MRSRALLCAVALAMASASVAQAQGIPLGEFSVLRFSPAPGGRNYFQVEGASVPGHIAPTVGLVVDYGHNPFILRNATCDASGMNCMVTGTRSEIVSFAVAGHVTATIALFDRIQIGAVVPVALSSGQAFNEMRDGRPYTLPGGTAFTLADPRLHVKAHIFGDHSSGLAIAASAFVTFPTGQAIAPRHFLGERLPTFGGSAIVELVRSGFHVAANVGGVWRDGDLFLSTYAGPQLTYAGALGYDITPLASVFGEFVGASTFSSQSDEHAMEWRAGGRLRVDDFQFDLAGGSAVGSGAGVPLFRILGGVQWSPVRADSDGDEVQDSQDACPSEPEDSDGWEDEDGCPETDNDNDGRLDNDDPCPTEAEDVDGTQDEDGCPDTDDDGDGVHDGYDSCPNEQEDRDGDRDDDGCPDNDTDHDGIDDPHDQCVSEAEDFDGFGDEDGCPEADFDSDQVPDESDQCPDQAEDTDGFEDDDGCPEEAGPPAHHHGRGGR